MAGQSASSTWLPGGQSAVSRAGFGDNDIQETVSGAVSTAQSGGSVSDYLQQRQQELARQQGARQQAAQQDATEEWIAQLRAQQAAQQDATEEWIAQLRAQQASQQAQSNGSPGTVKPGTRTPSGAAPTQPSAPVSTRTNAPVERPTVYDGDQTAGRRVKPNLPGLPTKPTTTSDVDTDPPRPDSGRGGSGSGGAPAANSAPATNSAPVASPTDYLSGAAETTGRITRGVDTTEQINAANRAWNDATRGYEGKAGEIIDQYGRSSQSGLDQYAGQSGSAIQNLERALQGATGQYGRDSASATGEYADSTESLIRQLSGITDKELADYAASTGQTIADAARQINDIVAGLQDKMQPADAGRVGRVDTVEEENLLDQIRNAQQQASENQINYAVKQGVNELQRAEEDAQEQFQTQRNQIAADERKSLDNSALYSEMRGDRGGIGKAQYDSIQNTAATNQLTVNKEQTKLSTDTARQIADLRAKGEFQKADELLKITQSYLSELMRLKQWADETNVGIDEFNIGVEQWEQEYNTKIQQLLGELSMDAVKYSTGLNLDNQQYLTGQRLSAARDEANMGLSRAGALASMKESSAANIANMLRSDAGTVASSKMSDAQFRQQQQQRLADALAQYGINNEQYVSQSDINRISNILSAQQANANNLASTEMAAANITGAFSDATPTQQARQQANAQLAAAGEAMLSAGLTPSDAQLSAMGWTKDQYNAYKAAADAAKKRGAGSGTQHKLLQLMHDSVETGVPLETIKEQLDRAVLSGNYGSADSKASTEYVAGLEGRYTGNPEG